MFTIDLLKGQGIPIKSRPGGAALLAVTIAVPVIAIIIMLGNYGRSKVELSMQRRALSNTNERIADLVRSVQLQEETKREIDSIKASFVEVADAIQQKVQWSPVLEVIADNMPDTIIMEAITIHSEDIRVKVVDRINPKKTLNISVPKRILRMTLYGKLAAETDNAVQHFLTALRNSSALNKKTERFEHISLKSIGGSSYEAVSQKIPYNLGTGVGNFPAAAGCNSSVPHNSTKRGTQDTPRRVGGERTTVQSF